MNNDLGGSDRDDERFSAGTADLPPNEAGIGPYVGESVRPRAAETARLPRDIPQRRNSDSAPQSVNRPANVYHPNELLKLIGRDRWRREGGYAADAALRGDDRVRRIAHQPPPVSPVRERRLRDVDEEIGAHRREQADNTGNNAPPVHDGANSHNRPGQTPKPQPASFDRQSIVAELERDRGYGLTAPQPDELVQLDGQVVESYFKEISDDFFAIINDYIKQSDEILVQYKKFSKSHRRWRVSIILATGILAAINVCAAFDLLKIEIGELSPNKPLTVSMILSAVAALFAGGLTVVATIENFLNKGEKASRFRDARDLLVDHYREYRFKWFYYVALHAETPIGCIYAGRLYRQLREADQLLRQKLKQLTEVQGSANLEAANGTGLGTGK